MKTLKKDLRFTDLKCRLLFYDIVAMHIFYEIYTIAMFTETPKCAVSPRQYDTNTISVLMFFAKKCIQHPIPLVL